MTDGQRGIQRKLRVLQHAERIGCVSKTCRYLGIALQAFIGGVLPIGSAARTGCGMPKSFRRPPRTERRPRSLRRCCTCAAIIIWGPFGSSGT